MVHFACCVPLRAGAFRCGTVVSLHDLYSFDIPEENFRPLQEHGLRGALWLNAFAMSGGIACVSESTRSRLEAWFLKSCTRPRRSVTSVEPDRCSHADAFHLVPPGRDFFLLCIQLRSTAGTRTLRLLWESFGRLIQRRVVPSRTQLGVVVGIAGPETASIRDRFLACFRSNVLLTSGLSDAQCHVVLSTLQAVAGAVDHRRFGASDCRRRCWLDVGCLLRHTGVRRDWRRTVSLRGLVRVTDRSAVTPTPFAKGTRARQLGADRDAPSFFAIHRAEYIDFYGRLACRISVSGMLQPTR